MRRITPSPTEIINNTGTYLVSLRPAGAESRILESLRLNDLPLVISTATGEALDFKIIQRLLAENAHLKDELIKLSLASYMDRENINVQTRLINFIFARLENNELFAFKELLKNNVIDDLVISQVINLIRLTGMKDLVKFFEILDSNLQGTLSLRHFLQNVEDSTNSTFSDIDLEGAKKVSKETLDSVNAKELESLSEIAKRAKSIDSEHIEVAEQIERNSDLNRIVYNTGITFGVSGLIWAGYRFGVWDTILNYLTSSKPRPLLEEEQSSFDNARLAMAAATGFILKKGLLRR